MLRRFASVLLLGLGLGKSASGLISGQLADRHEFKSAILLKTLSDGLPYFGAVLMFEAEYILTSASCSLSDLSAVRAYAGVHDSNYDEITMQNQSLETRMSITIPGDSEPAVALYKLVQPFVRNEYVLSAEFIHQRLRPTTGDSGVLPDWGSTNVLNMRGGNKKLRKVELNITMEEDDPECADILEGAVDGDPQGSLFCGGQSRGGGVGGCDADRGGLLQCKDGIICDILIHGSCGKPKDYDVYADVSWYAQYIQEAVGALTMPASGPGSCNMRKMCFRILADADA